DDAVDAEGLGRPQDRPEVAWILNLVEDQVERWLSPFHGLGQQVLDVDVLSRAHPSDDALMLGGARHRGELIPGAEGDFDAGASASGLRNDSCARAARPTPPPPPSPPPPPPKPPLAAPRRPPLRSNARTGLRP